MERRLALKQPRGQVMVLVTPILAVFTLFMVFALAYGSLTLRAMRAIAIADTSAHAGAMEIHVLPNGKIVATDRAQKVAAQYFLSQAPEYAKLEAVHCGVVPEGPYCELTIRVTSAFLFADSHVNVRSVLAYGATRERQ